MTNLKARLNGVLIEEHCEPSHSLLDLATQLYDQNILRFIPLEKCFSRLTELSFSNKAQTKLLEVEFSKVVIKEKDADFESAVQSSYQALEAFKRRRLALEFAGVMSYTAHDQYVQMLFSHPNREPPVGYNRVSVSQLLSADKAAWSSLIEKNLKPRPDAAGVLPLNASLEDALKAYEVSFTLLPMVSKAQPKASPAPPQSTRPPAAAPFSKGHHKGQFRPKPYGTKGKGKSKSKFEQRIPQQIRDTGGTASTPDGDPICFDYSLKRCKEQVTDGRCRKGYHVCCLCYGQHCMLDHKKSWLAAPNSSARKRKFTECTETPSASFLTMHDGKDPPSLKDPGQFSLARLRIMTKIIILNSLHQTAAMMFHQVQPLPTNISPCLKNPFPWDLCRLGKSHNLSAEPRAICIL